MPNKQKLYKIDINAQQNHLTGICILTEKCNLVVVEGGPKAQKRYRKLLTQRIDWHDVQNSEDEDLEDEDLEEARRKAASEVSHVVTGSWSGGIPCGHG